MLRLEKFLSRVARERDCPVILCPFECIDCLGGVAAGLTVRKVGSGRLERENRTWEKGERDNAEGETRKTVYYSWRVRFKVLLKRERGLR